MSLLRRREPAAPAIDDDVIVDASPATVEPEDSFLRDEVDPDPLVEEAVERLRDALGTLVARDEWGRPLPWRQVARIAIGPLLTQLRDVQTAAQLLDATRPDPSAVPSQNRTEVGSGWPGDALFWND
ncbi:MAG TPA: hypothetical protein VFH66_11625 [Mycobacteriales bacterium]|nr:hypothetical protein [Mycobacteriales bacterium]